MNTSSPLSKMNRHALIMVICCAIPLLALLAIYGFGVPVSQALTIGLVLLCPLGHLLMMGTMGGHNHEDQSPASARTIDAEPKGNGGAACH